MSAYRNELEAAQARIAHLTATIDALERERSRDPAPPRFAWRAMLLGAGGAIALCAVAASVVSPPMRPTVLHAPPVMPPPPDLEAPAMSIALADHAASAEPPAPAVDEPSVIPSPRAATDEPRAEGPSATELFRNAPQVERLADQSPRIDRGLDGSDPSMDLARYLMREDPGRASTTFYGQYWTARVVRSEDPALPVDTACLVRLIPGGYRGSGRAAVQCTGVTLSNMAVSPPERPRDDRGWCWFDGVDLFCAPPDRLAEEHCWISTVGHTATCRGNVHLSLNTRMRDPRTEPLPRL